MACLSQIVMLLCVCRVPFVFVIAVIAWGQFLLIRFYKVIHSHINIFECRPPFLSLLLCSVGFLLPSML